MGDEGSSGRDRIRREDIESVLGAELPWSQLDGASILVTGAAGMLPGFMTDVLLDMKRVLGYGPACVVGLVRSRDKAYARFREYHGRRDFQLLVADVADAGTSIESPLDYIVHAASQASPRFYTTDPVGTLMANVAGTLNLLRFAQVKRASRLLFFSSAEVYGAPSVTPIHEQAFGALDPMLVRSCYAESKRLAETMCVSWAHQFGTPTAVVRPFHTYGPGMSFDDGRVFADFIAAVVDERDIVVKSDGSARRTFCYITDATAGFFSVLLKGQLATAYNVGNDEAEMSILELANTLVAAFPDKGIRVVIAPEEMPADYSRSTISRICPDTSRLRGLGWEPRVSIVDGFARTVSSFSAAN